MTQIKFHGLENADRLLDNYIAAMREEMTTRLQMAAAEIAAEIAGKAGQYFRAHLVKMHGVKGYEVSIVFEIPGVEDLK